MAEKTPRTHRESAELFNEFKNKLLDQASYFQKLDEFLILTGLIYKNQEVAKLLSARSEFSKLHKEIVPDLLKGKLLESKTELRRLERFIEQMEIMERVFERIGNHAIQNNASPPTSVLNLLEKNTSISNNLKQRLDSIENILLHNTNKPLNRKENIPDQKIGKTTLYFQNILIPILTFIMGIFITKHFIEPSLTIDLNKAEDAVATTSLINPESKFGIHFPENIDCAYKIDRIYQLSDYFKNINQLKKQNLGDIEKNKANLITMFDTLMAKCGSINNQKYKFSYDKAYAALLKGHYVTQDYDKLSVLYDAYQTDTIRKKQNTKALFETLFWYQKQKNIDSEDHIIIEGIDHVLDNTTDDIEKELEVFEGLNQNLKESLLIRKNEIKTKLKNIVVEVFHSKDNNKVKEADARNIVKNLQSIGYSASFKSANDYPAINYLKSVPKLPFVYYEYGMVNKLNGIRAITDKYMPKNNFDHTTGQPRKYFMNYKISTTPLIQSILFPKFESKDIHFVIVF